jgi:hypothetical protein
VEAVLQKGFAIDLGKAPPTKAVMDGRWDMVVTFCPFCGLGTGLPHETQEACIAALNEEIARMRLVVSRLRVGSADDVSGDNPNPRPAAEDRL